MSDPSRRDEIVNKLHEVKDVPSLRRGNGFGFTLLGTITDNSMPGVYFKMYWFTALWIPIFPTEVFAVDRRFGSSYRVLRSMTIRDFNSVFAGQLIKFYLSVLVESVLFIILIVFALGIAFFVTKII